MPSTVVATMGAVVRLARDVRTELDRQFDACGLTSQQAGVLIHVFTGQRSPSRIGDLLGTDAAGMTRLLDRLESKGFVTREADPSDRRAVVVALTERGAALVPALPPVFERVGAVLGAEVSAAEVATTLRVLTAMQRSLAPGDT